ncbi:AAA family ATPase [Kribbella sp. NPDC051718]|uniref:phosphotransferase-like protein n=1 Tax=Kribbella sp. NPDC051718 TaxID=3155168 RepID=UPI003449FF9F
MSRIVFLNGAPSTGKTTLARALHAALPGPVFYQSLDDFRGSIRPEFWIHGRVPGLFERVVDTYVACLRDVAAHGLDVVAESLILPADLPRYAELFGSFDVTMVGITCPLVEIRRREAGRTDRYNGFLEPDVATYEAVNSIAYELLIDTSTEPTGTSLERILRYLDKRFVGSVTGSS